MTPQTTPNTRHSSTQTPMRGTSMPATRTSITRTRRAFTLIEIMVVVIILGAIAAVVVPQFAGATDDARTSAAESIIHGVRTSIDAYSDRAARRGTNPYPSLADLVTPGVVVMRALPANPFTGVSGVQAVSRKQADSRAVFNQGSAGWNFYVDNAEDDPRIYFYANCETATTVPDGQGGTLTANEL